MTEKTLEEDWVYPTGEKRGSSSLNTWNETDRTKFLTRKGNSERGWNMPTCNQGRGRVC